MTNVFKKLDENQGKLVWRLWFILMVELLGTFAMVFEIIAPNALDLGQFDWYKMIFGTFFMKAVWVTGFIWILIMICGKVSVNLNPAVTISEVSAGKFGWNRASLMLVVQFVGALAAAEVAYQLGGLMNVEGTTLDAVYPVLQAPAWWFGEEYGSVHTVWNEGMTVFNGNESFSSWAIATIPFMLIEAIFTYGLIASVFEGNFKFMARSFVICIPLTFIVMFGIFTHNIALNPARLLGPAIIGQMHAGLGHSTGTLQFTWIFLCGELLAILLFKLRCNVRDEKEGATPSSMRKEVRMLASETLVTKARYSWVLVGNKPLEQMSKDELVYAAKFCEIEFSNKESKDDLEFDLIEWIIFGLEEKQNPPLITKKSPAKKAPAKKPVVKKEPVKTLTKEEVAKRDAKREAAKKKVEKLGGDLKKLKLTDLYGVGPKIEEYYKKHNISDLVQLSKFPNTKITKKFIEELPALKSWTPEMKKDKIESNISEAKFMVKELTK